MCMFRFSQTMYEQCLQLNHKKYQNAWYTKEANTLNTEHESMERKKHYGKYKKKLRMTNLTYLFLVEIPQFSWEYVPLENIIFVAS